MANVVAWSDSQIGPALTAAVCGKAFFSTLRNPTATAPEVRLQPVQCLPCFASGTMDIEHLVDGTCAGRSRMLQIVELSGPCLVCSNMA